MILFDDASPNHKLLVYNHKIDWIQRVPIPHPDKAQPIEVPMRESLKAECEHFIDCLTTRKPPRTNGNEGLRVLKILELCQQSIKNQGKVFTINKVNEQNYFFQESAYIDDVEIGEGSKIRHFSHILKNTMNCAQKFVPPIVREFVCCKRYHQRAQRLLMEDDDAHKKLLS